MIGWRLGAPGALALLLAVAAIAAAGAWSLVRARRLLRATFGPQASRVAPGAGTLRPALRLALAACGLALLAAALARPERMAADAAVTPPGLDLAVALDASRSMRARDVLPDRLERAKLELAALLDRLPGDEVALVAFAGSAFVQSPLGMDRAALRLLADAVDPASMPVQGTALAEALDVAGRALGPPRPGRGRAVLLVTDGEDHEGGAAAAAARLARAGIALVVVGIGTPAGGVVPPDGAGRDRQIVSRLDEAALRAVAAAAGGAFVAPGASADGLRAVATALAGARRGEVVRRGAARWSDRSVPFAAGAFALLLASALLPARRLRRPGIASGARSRTSKIPTPGKPAARRAASLLLALLGASPFRAEHDGVRAANALVASDPAAALAGYDAAERELGPRPEIDLGRGDALLALGRREEARRAFELAARAPGRIGSRGSQNLAHVRLATGDEAAAVSALREALAQDASNQAARHDLEVLLRRRAEVKQNPERRAGEGAGREDHAHRQAPAPPDAASRAPDRPVRAEVDGRSAEASPLSREEAERLLDAVAAAERPLPVPPTPRSPRVAKDW